MKQTAFLLVLVFTASCAGSRQVDIGANKIVSECRFECDYEITLETTEASNPKELHHQLIEESLDICDKPYTLKIVEDRYEICIHCSRGRDFHRLKANLICGKDDRLLERPEKHHVYQ